MIRFLAFTFALTLALVFHGAPARADCTLTQNGQTRPPGTIVLETVNNIALYCDGTVWKPLAFAAGAGGGGGSECPVAAAIYGENPAGNYYNDVIKLGNYIFTAENDSGSAAYISAFTFNGAAVNHITSLALGGTQWAHNLWSDGTYIYVANGTSGVRALSFDGSAFTLIATYDTAGDAYDVWGDGTYIYVGDGANGIVALAFNGTAWAPATGVLATSTYNSPDAAAGVWGDGTYIYLADDDTVIALTFNGTAWAFATGALGTSSYDSPNDVYNVAGDGTYLYISEAFYGIRALTFNGTAWTSLATQYNIGGDSRLSVYDPYIFIGGVAAAALTFNGTAFTVKGYYPGYPGASSAASDGAAIYVTGDFGGVRAYPACSGGGGGGGSDTTPDAFSFTDQAPVALSTLIQSDIVQITGIDVAAAVSISGGGTPEYRTCSDAACTAVIANWGSVAGTINNNEYVQVRLTSSASQATASAATLTVDVVTDDFDITTTDTTPDPFTFTDQTGIALSTLTTSDVVQITGINAAAAISVAGGGAPQFQVCSDSSCTGVVVNWTATANTVSNNQYVRTRLTSSAAQSTLLASTVSIGGVSDAFDVTTGDFTPNAYSFTMSLSQPGSTQVTSNIVQITGINGATATSIAGGGSPQYRTCSDASCTTEIQTWASGAASIQNNQYLQVRGTTPASGTITVTMTVGTGGTATANWYASTNGRGFFVLSSSGSNGNFGGRTGADGACLTNLTAGSWLNKASATLDAAHVFSFFCDGTGCNNLQANTIYQFARSGSGTAGGAVFVTNASGRGPGNGTDWSGATLFNASQDFWSGRGAGSSTLWPTTAGGSHCTNWSDGTIALSGVNGKTDANDDGRWNDGSDFCDSSLRYVCFVNP